MIYEFQLADRTERVEILPHEQEGWWVRVGDGPRRHVLSRQRGAAEWWLDVDGTEHRLGAHVSGDRVAIQHRGEGFLATIVDPRSAAFDAGGGGAQGAILSPMPGVVVRLPVKEGDPVEEGDLLVVIEAMKMENEYRSPMKGVVAEVHVRVGAPIDSGTMLVRVEASDD